MISDDCILCWLSLRPYLLTNVDQM